MPGSLRNYDKRLHEGRSGGLHRLDGVVVELHLLHRSEHPIPIGHEVQQRVRLRLSIT